MKFATVKEAYRYVDTHVPYRCSGCKMSAFLSHSHLVPRSECKELETETDNIRIHCMSFAEHTGCHNKIDTMQFVFLDDFTEIMLYIFKVKRSYFWQRFFKLMDHWKKQPVERNKLPMYLLYELERKVSELEVQNQ